MVRGLSIPAQVGCAEWLEQHEDLERLNLQAHHNVHCHSDEFVMAALVAFDKLPLLVHELLVSEASQATRLRFLLTFISPSLSCHASPHMLP